MDLSEQTVSVIQNVAYLIASILFIRGLKGLTHPRTAVRGNLTGSLAMLIAVVRRSGLEGLSNGRGSSQGSPSVRPSARCWP